MGKSFDYTRLAKKFPARYPMLSYTALQINFWIWANIILVIIVYMSMMAVARCLTISMSDTIGEMFVVSVILGGIYGLFQGTADYYVENILLVKSSLGRYLIYKLLFSTVFSFIFFGIYGFLLTKGVVQLSGFNRMLALNPNSLKYFFVVYLFFYFIMNILLIFINQVNKKYGPGVLIPLLLGKYAEPVEEERIFLFMDLKSSTSLAEKMGHIRYSNFIRDAFLDINGLLFSHNAEVYQYVGDEIVLSWPVENTVDDTSPVNFFFACEKRFFLRTNYYLSKYDAVPDFKAGLHAGKVIAVEIGNIKRDIAYHGDILNTAARIQSLCNYYQRKLLASGSFADSLQNTQSFTIGFVDKVNLKGKSKETEIVSISLNSAI